MSALPEEPLEAGHRLLPAPGASGLHDVVVVGCSAGGDEALRTLLAALPGDLPATVLAVLHLPRAGSPDDLAGALSRVSALPVLPAADGAPLVPGTVVVAVPDRHLAVVGDRLVLAAGPTENGCRPAVDVLFRSAAHAFSGRVVGVVLTGDLDDGSAGLRAVVRHGGLALVQDPDDALFPSMPRCALDAVPDAVTAPLGALPALLTELVHRPAAQPRRPEEAGRDEVEVGLALGASPGPRTADHPGVPSAWSCPDCSGVLWEVADGPLPRYRCRTGHAWSAASLLQEQDRGIDAALWVALRALEERYALSLRVAAAAERGERSRSAEHVGARTEEVAAQAAVLRRLLTGGPGPVPLPVEPPRSVEPEGVQALPTERDGW